MNSSLAKVKQGVRARIFLLNRFDFLGRGCNLRFFDVNSGFLTVLGRISSQTF